MTSNIGVKKLQDFGSGIGFATENKISNSEEIKKAFLQKELKNHFSPEFLNRVDEVIIFKSLSNDDVLKIVNVEIDKLVKRLNKMNYLIDIDLKVRKFIADVGFDEKYGARPIKRAIQEKIEDLISEEVLKGNIVEGVSKKIRLSKKDTITIV
jgi:ATP-dependent Clp protease ATP-binding subunit ClpC